MASVGRHRETFVEAIPSDLRVLITSGRNAGESSGGEDKGEEVAHGCLEYGEGTGIGRDEPDKGHSIYTVGVTGTRVPCSTVRIPAPSRSLALLSTASTAPAICVEAAPSEKLLLWGLQRTALRMFTYRCPGFRATWRHPLPRRALPRGIRPSKIRRRFALAQRHDDKRNTQDRRMGTAEGHC